MDIKTSNDVPCDWCGTSYATNTNGKRSPQKKLNVVHKRTGEQRAMWLCWPCRNRPTRTVWLAWMRADDAERDAKRAAEQPPYGIREVRRRRRRVRSFERRRAESLRRTNEIVRKVEATLARVIDVADAERIAKFERRRVMAQEAA